MGGVSVMPPDVRYFVEGDEFDWKAWVAPLEWVCRELNIVTDLTCRGIITHDIWNHVIDTTQKCAAKARLNGRLHPMEYKARFGVVSASDINTISDNIAILIKGVYP